MTTFIKTLDILNALKIALAAIQLPSTYADVPAYPAAFNAVEIYGAENILKAFEDMYVFDDRACFIIPGGDTHEHEKPGNVLQVKRETEVHLLMADRNYGRENLALVGEAGSNPGALVLKDLVIDSLTGPSLASVNNVVLVPTTGDPLVINDPKNQGGAGRYCWAQTFTTSAGAAKVAIR